MRLTLRTLLAYLDDTLEPAQAKIIGQKVAENEPARELMEHIKQVTRRRRITTPPTNGHSGKIDPNTIAEYLDSAVTAEQASEVEQICLASDAHLAEVAACHQILALVLGEPALVPPTAKTRMYGLVKGPESIPFRKPTNPIVSDNEQDPASDDVDETLRMGLPALGGGHRMQNLLLIGSGIAAALLLGVAIFHLLDLRGGEVEPPKDPIKDRVQVVQNDDKKKPEAKVEPKEIKTEPKEPKVEPKVKDVPKKQPGKIEYSNDLPPPPFPPEDDPKEKPPVKPSTTALPEFRNTAPDDRPFPLGKYLMPAGTEASVVVSSPVGKSDWTRLWGKNLDLQSGRTYVSLPGCKSELQLTRNVQLTLWGSLPEILPAPLFFESVVELHNNDQYDLDMTLLRGRVIVGCRSDKAVAVRVRFENPAQANTVEIADMLLQGKGTQIIIDRGGGWLEPPPFVKNPNSPERVPPSAFQGFCVLKGTVTFRLGDVSYTLTGPPGPALLVWNSVDGLKSPQVVDKLPDAFSLGTKPPPLPMELDKKIRDAVLKARNEVLTARDDLSSLLIGNNNKLDTTLTELTQSSEPGRRIIGVRCYAATSSLPDLVYALSDERFSDVRQTAIRSLQNWIAVGRDNEYRLYDQLTAYFKMKNDWKEDKAEKVSEKVMELLHGFAPPEVLVDNLNNSVLAIREMSYLNLLPLAPPGQPLPQYDPTMPADQRMAAQQAWRELLRRAPKKAPPPPPAPG